MRKSFHGKLENLNQELLKMGTMVEETINNAVTSLKDQDLELAQQVIDNDDYLDDYELRLEKKSLELIALQQPVAKDLRLIDMISKIATDLERIADLAQNIAEITIKIKDDELIKPLVDISRMSELVQKMVTDCLKAFINQDVELAKEVASLDDEVDNLDEQNFRTLLSYMIEDAKTIKQANNLMFVSRYLERMGDHATNICEKIIYIVNAERVSY